MLQLFDKNKTKIAGLIKYKNLCIESVLSTGDSTLSFNFPVNNVNTDLIEEEGYIRTKQNEYVVKEINKEGSYLDIKCSLNVEDLEGKPWEHFNTDTTTIEDCLNLAFAGTGWVVAYSNVNRKRTIKLTNCTSWTILKEAKKVFRVDYRFDSINKKLYIYEKLGEDKGTYFIESLNLKAINVQSNTYDFYTRIIPIGKDGLTIDSINDGKGYLENFQYATKIKTLYWKDERYTIKESLKEDAEYKLNELSKPYKAYATNIIDLAKLNPKYKNILSYSLGDTVTLISKSQRVKDKQRIVKITEYPQEAYRNTCELANTTLTFEELQQSILEATETISNITTDNGTIDGSTIDSIEKDQIKDFNIEVGKVVNLDAVNANIENLQVNKADITSLNAVHANIGNLEATKANISELQAANAKIENLQATKAEILELEAATAKIGILEAETAKIQDLVSGNISSENMQAGGITGDRLNMNTVFIQDANIVNVNASKMNAGEVNTNKVKIKSEDGGVEIVGATQQFRDKNNKVRIQMGKDIKGDFNFIIRGEDGTTTLIDHTGVKEKAIADDLIKENMIAPDAVGEKQIDYNSFATGFNKDTNTTTIKATKVRLDNQNQTLEVGFTNLKNQAYGTKTQTESNTTQINVQQGQINTAIANTKIVKDGKEILLKDDYNTTVATVNSMKNTISSHTTKLDEHTGKITGVESKTNVLERDVNSMKSTISSTENIVNTHTTQINNVITSANNANDKIDNLEIGGRNLARNTDNEITTGSKSFKVITDEIEKLIGKKVTISVDVECINGVSSSNNGRLGAEFSITFTDGTYQYFGAWEHINTTPKTVKRRVFYTYTINNSKQIESINNLGIYIQRTTSGSFKVSKPKIEAGTKMTGWTPAPEDIQENITTINTEITSTKNKVSGIEQNLDSVTTKVGSIEKTTTSHTATIKNHTDSLNLVDGKIDTAKNQAINTASTDAKTKADKALNDAKGFTNTEITKVNTTINNKVAEIKTTTDSITQSVSNTNKEVTNVKATITNIKVGGRNYLKLSNPNLTTSGYHIINLYLGDTKPKESEEFTISIKGLLGIGKAAFGIYNSGGTVQMTAIYPADRGTDGVYRKTFKWAIGSSNNTHISFYALYNSVTVESSIEWVMLEKGNKSSDWCAAPEDISKEILDITTEKVNQVKAEIKTTTDSINLEVNNTKREVENVNIKVNNIQVGGRNTFRKNNSITRLISTPIIEIPSLEAPNGFKLTGIKDVDNASVRIKDVITDNGEWVFSGWIKSNGNTTINCDVCDGVFFNIITKANQWVRFEHTFKVANYSEVFNFIDLNNLQWLYYWFKDVKIEKGNKSTGWSPAPEDVSKEITDITTEKVNQAKADIKLTTDSISSKVNSIESTTNTINGKVTSHENRLTAAENKITPTAIISTVQNTINTAKNEAINSANSSTDSKLNNYTTKSQFTELKQTSENFQYKIENTTNKYNLINNGSLKNTKNFNLWDQEGVTWYENDYGTGIQGKMGSNKAYMTSSFIDVSRLDGSFSLAVQAHAQQNTLGAEIQLVGYNSLKDLNVIWGSQKLSFGHLDGKVIRKIEDFSIPSNVNWIKVNVTHFGMTSEYSNVFFIDFINFTNTTIALLDYNLPTKGFAQNIVTIDDSVIRCDFEDGSYSSMGRGGHRYYAKGMSRPYQYITFKSHLPYNKNGQWVKLYLPAMFQGKKIDEDFQLTVTTGAVDSGTNRTGAIRSIFGQVGTWNPNEGSVTVRGCLQRLEVNTLTFTGWDSSTTTEGNEIGGGYIDLIVTAQM